MDDILAEFVAETLETLETLSGEVIAWEADPTDSSRLDAFFRFFHTVKGSCGFLSLPRFERLAHGAEGVLAAIRQGDRAADPQTVSAVLAIMDRIGELAKAIDAPEQIPETQDDALLDALNARSATVEIFEPLPASPAPKQAPAPPEPQLISAAQAPDEPTQSEPAQPHEAVRASAPRSIRLPLMLIDQLMNSVSDMVLARNDLARKMRERAHDPELESSFERLSTNVADLRDMISKTRMQRVDRLYAALPRLVRDLGRELGKKITLDLDGGDVEMDREMIEMVLDPLTHIVRNALDHGIEPPAERAAANKAATGRLRIIARQSGNQIGIEVCDDGRGIDRDRLVAKAIANGQLNRDEAAAMTDADKLGLIFQAGLSTAEALTTISGRGVGMDVVRANVEQIGGVIEVESKLGVGTRISMRVPLTLTIIPGLIVRGGGHFFAMPRGNVIELLHDTSAMVAIEEIAGARIAVIRGERYSMIDIEDVLEIQRATDQRGPRTLMVIRSSVGEPYVLGVEAVDSNEELVIRPASPLVTSAGIYAGMTLPDNGQPMLLLDAAGIARQAGLPLRDQMHGHRAGNAPAATDDVPGETIQALLYTECDGSRRLMPLSIIDRVEDVSSSQIITSGDAAYIRLDGRLMPALNVDGAVPEAAKSLRLQAGRDQLAYLIDRVFDIVEIPAEPHARIGVGRIAGLVMLEDGQVELIDPFAIFAEAASHGDAAIEAPCALRCLIPDADDAWMRGILAPLLRQAGHKVVIGPTLDDPGDSSGADASDRPDIILCTIDNMVAQAGDVPVLALRSDPDAGQANQGSVYRYDRAQVLGAIRDLAKRSAA